MSSFSPFEPDFKSLHERGLADTWWAVSFPIAIASAAVPAILSQMTFGIYGLTAFITVISYYWLFAHAFHLGWKERTVLALDDQELDSRLWAASKSQQLRLGFESVGYYFGFEMLAKQIGLDTSCYDGHEFIVRTPKDTVAVANVIRIHDRAYWPAAIYEFLELDGSQISLSSLFEQEEIRMRVNQAQIAKSDFVCIGLTTHAVETVGKRGPAVLSKLRAKSLGEALISYAGLNYRRSKFYAVGLGQSLTSVGDGENEEARNQRSAVILAITRRQDISEVLDLERITEALVQNYRTDRLDLSNYELSSDIARQLQQNEIDFAGFV